MPFATENQLISLKQITRAAIMKMSAGSLKWQLEIKQGLANFCVKHQNGIMIICALKQAHLSLASTSPRSVIETSVVILLPDIARGLMALCQLVSVLFYQREIYELWILSAVCAFLSAHQFLKHIFTSLLSVCH